jgi:hypothetical protein
MPPLGPLSWAGLFDWPDPEQAGKSNRFGLGYGVFGQGVTGPWGSVADHANWAQGRELTGGFLVSAD